MDSGTPKRFIFIGKEKDTALSSPCVDVDKIAGDLLSSSSPRDFIVQRGPDLDATDSHGANYLPCLLKNKLLSPDLLDIIIELRPDDFAKKDHLNNYPLSALFYPSSKATAKMQMAAIRIFPEAAKSSVVSEKGKSMSMLHHVLVKSNKDTISKDVIQLLVDICPSATTYTHTFDFNVDDQDCGPLSRYPLDLAIKKNLGFDILELLINDFSLLSGSENSLSLPVQRMVIANNECISLYKLRRPLPYTPSNIQCILQQSIDILCTEPDYLSTSMTNEVAARLASVVLETCDNVDQHLWKLLEQFSEVYFRDILSVALNHGAELATIRRIFDGYPFACGTTDDRNRYPLHYLRPLRNMTPADYPAYVDLVNLFLEQNEESIWSVDKDGLLPLHTALQHRAPAPVIITLLEKYPGACSQVGGRFEDVDTGGRFEGCSNLLPLHCAFEYNRNMSVSAAYTIEDGVIQELLRCYPQACAKTDFEGNLPLHIALHAEPSVDDIKRNKQQLSGEILRPSHEIIALLVSTNPDACKVKNKDGTFPLHLAVRRNREAETVKMILMHYPDVCHDERYTLPLFDAAEYSNEATVALLLPHSPVTGYDSRRDKKGMLLVQRVIMGISSSFSSDRLNILKIVVALCPEAMTVELLRKPDRLSSQKMSGNALYHALHTPTVPLPFIEYLLTYDFVLRGKEVLMSTPPTSRTDVVEIAVLVVSNRLQRNFALGEIWHDFLDESCTGLNTEAKCALVSTILSQHRGQAKSLCHAKDSKGRVALHIVDHQVKTVMQSFIFFCGRFELAQGPVVHKSSTSMVVQALDFAPSCDWQKVFDRYSIRDPLHEGKSCLDLQGFVKAGRSVGLFDFDDIAQVAVNDKAAWLPAAADNATWSQGSVVAFENNETIAVMLTKSNDGSDIERRVNVDMLRSPSIINIASLFHAQLNFGSSSSGDKFKDGAMMTKENFLRCCEDKLGETRKVVLKFMRHEDQYLREVNFREDLISKNGSSNNNSVLELLTPPDAALFVQDIQTLVIQHQPMHEYQYCLVMPEADRNLDSIRRFERPDLDSIRLYARDVARALMHLHDQGIMHGDVKLLNAIRLNHCIRLIDLDAACCLEDGWAGAKFSSGILPPEMFVELDTTQQVQYEAYWQPIQISDPELWRKVRPVNIGSGKCVVVRTFRVDVESGDPVQPQLLPYDLVPATAAIDAWSFGVLLYSMLARCSLLLVSDDDDLVSLPVHDNHPSTAAGSSSHSRRRGLRPKREKQPIQLAKDWSPESIEHKLSIIESEAARDLLSRLLHPDARQRLCNMSKVLQHPFFTGKDPKMDILLSKMNEANATLKTIQKGVERIEQLSQQMLQRIDTTKKVLLKSMVESHDVVVPSCFVIVNQRILPATAKDVDNDVAEDEVSTLGERISKADRWLSKLSRFVNAVSDPHALFEQAQETMQQLFLGESDTLYLYLVDEVTLTPIVPADDNSCYPIEIKVKTPEQADRAKRLLPLMKVSITAISLINSGSGLARCLGYPTPRIPPQVTSTLRNAMQTMDEASSLHQFDCIEALALGQQRLPTSEETTKNKTVRGQALRQLQALLAEYDTAGSFCGLQRVVPASSKDGAVLWTTEEGLQQLEAGSVQPLLVDSDMMTSSCGLEDGDWEVVVRPDYVTGSIDHHMRPAAQLTSIIHCAPHSVAVSASKDDSYSVSSPTAVIGNEEEEEEEDEGESAGELNRQTFVALSHMVHTAHKTTDSTPPNSLVMVSPVFSSSVATLSAAAATTTTATTENTVDSGRGRLQSVLLEDPRILQRLEKSSFSVDVCVCVIYEAAQLIFGPYRHNVAKPRRLGLSSVVALARNKVSLVKELQVTRGSTKTSGAIVVQTLKKCTSNEGVSLYYQLPLSNWLELLSLEEDLHHVSLRVAAAAMSPKPAAKV